MTETIEPWKAVVPLIGGCIWCKKSVRNQWGGAGYGVVEDPMCDDCYCKMCDEYGVNGGE